MLSEPYNQDTAIGPGFREYAVSDHAEAAARLLCMVARKLRRGIPPEEVGEEVELLGRVMRRAI